MRNSLANAGLIAFAALTAPGLARASDQVLGWKNMATGEFRPAAGTPPPASATAVGGSVKTTISGAVTPTLPARSTIYCQLWLVITAHSADFTYTYTQNKQQTAAGAISGATYSCNMQLGYSALMVTSSTNPTLNYSVNVFAVDSKAPPGLPQGFDLGPRSFIGTPDNGSVTIPLPASGTTTTHNFSIVF